MNKILLNKILKFVSLTSLFFVLIFFLYSQFIVKPESIGQAIKNDQLIVLNIKNIEYISHKEDVKAHDEGDQLSDIHNLPTHVLPLESHTPAPNKNHKIAIILINLGLNRNITEQAFKLPSEIAFGFSAYTNSLKNLMQKAHEDGHELYIEIPFEPSGYPMDDPGPLGLISSLDIGENITRLDLILSNFKYFTGLYGLPNEKFSSDHDKFNQLMDYFNKNNLFFISGYKNKTLTDIPFCSMFIDLSMDPETIKNNFRLIEQLSQGNQSIIIFVNAYPMTIGSLLNWIEQLKQKNIELVHPSKLSRPAK